MAKLKEKMDIWTAVFNSHINNALEKASEAFKTKYGKEAFNDLIKPFIDEGLMSIFKSHPDEYSLFFTRYIMNVVNGEDPEPESGSRVISAIKLKNLPSEERIIWKRHFIAELKKMDIPIVKKALLLQNKLNSWIDPGRTCHNCRVRIPLEEITDDHLCSECREAIVEIMDEVYGDK